MIKNRIVPCFIIYIGFTLIKSDVHDNNYKRNDNRLIATFCEVHNRDEDGE